MIELTINLEVALKSGARVTLSEAQTRLAKSYIETLITGEAPKEMLPPITQLVRTKRKYRRRGTRRSFTSEEDARILSIIRTYPVTGRGKAANKYRKQALRSLAKELNRTEASINSRVNVLRHLPVKDISVLLEEKETAVAVHPISVTLG